MTLCWVDAGSVVLTRARVAAFAAAVGETRPALLSGSVCPPTMAVLPPWAAQNAVVDSVLSREESRLGLHGEQRFRFLRPLRPDVPLRGRSRLEAVVPRSTGSTVTLRSQVHDDEGLLNESLFTLFVLGRQLPARGDPGCRLAGEPSPSVVGSTTVEERVADDQAARYAAASGDTFEIHLSDTAARAVGLPGVILHGMCTLAFAARALVSVAADGEPERLAYLGARFSAPVWPGSVLRTSVGVDGSSGTFSTCTGDGAQALSRGIFAVASAVATDVGRL